VRKEKKRKERKGKEKKIANYRIETCRRVFVSTPLHQVGAVTFQHIFSHTLKKQSLRRV
jgi:hypothetical protein